MPGPSPTPLIAEIQEQLVGSRISNHLISLKLYKNYFYLFLFVATSVFGNKRDVFEFFVTFLFFFWKVKRLMRRKTSEMHKVKHFFHHHQKHPKTKPGVADRDKNKDQPQPEFVGDLGSG